MRELNLAAAECEMAEEIIAELEAKDAMSNINEDVPKAGYFDYGPEENGCLWLGRLVWVGIILAAIAIVSLAAWGLCATALSRGEAWAQWPAGVLFLVAFAIMLREIKGG